MSDDQPQKWRENTPLEPLIGMLAEEQPYIGPPPSGPPADPSGGYGAPPAPYGYGVPGAAPAPYSAPPPVPGYGYGAPPPPAPGYGGYGGYGGPPVQPYGTYPATYGVPFVMTRPPVNHPVLLAKSVAVGLVTIIGLSLLMHFATPRNPFDDGFQPGAVGQIVHLHR